MFKNTSNSAFVGIIDPADFEMLQRVYETCSGRISSSAEAEQFATEIVQLYLRGERDETALTRYLANK